MAINRCTRTNATISCSHGSTYSHLGRPYHFLAVHKHCRLSFSTNAPPFVNKQHKLTLYLHLAQPSGPSGCSCPFPHCFRYQLGFDSKFLRTMECKLRLTTMLPATHHPMTFCSVGDCFLLSLCMGSLSFSNGIVRKE